jgi:tetratricopeptide (TPR) repeat protein
MLLSVLVLVLTMQAPAAPAVEEARQAYAAAMAHFDSNENPEALAAFDRAIALDPGRAEYFVGRGRTLARLRRYDEAFEAYDRAARLDPSDPMILRDRGHSYINVRKIDLALADLEKAEAMKKDDFGIYYHLALAYYLKGEFSKAADAYAGCVRTSTSDDDRVACWAWQYPSLLRAGRAAEAKAVLDRITPDLDVTENAAYLDRLLLFKGVKTEEDVAAQMDASSLNLSTVGYGIGLWHLLNDRPAKAREYFEKASSGEYWPAFGYVAGEVELARMK